MDVPRPPVETGGRADHVGVLLQLSAVGELRVLQVLDGGELAVDEAGVGQRPQMLGAVGCSGASAALPTPPPQGEGLGVGPYTLRAACCSSSAASSGAEDAWAPSSGTVCRPSARTFRSTSRRRWSAAARYS